MAVVCGLVFGCSPNDAVPSLSFPVSAFPAVLTISGRGNPPLSVEIGAYEAGRIPCDGGVAVAPGDAGVPPLPWDIRVVRQSDGHVLLSSHVTDLPRWITAIGGEEAGITSFPVAGPPGPSCPPGS